MQQSLAQPSEIPDTGRENSIQHDPKLEKRPLISWVRKFILVMSHPERRNRPTPRQRPRIGKMSRGTINILNFTLSVCTIQQGPVGAMVAREISTLKAKSSNLLQDSSKSFLLHFFLGFSQLVFPKESSWSSFFARGMDVSPENVPPLVGVRIHRMRSKCQLPLIPSQLLQNKSREFLFLSAGRNGQDFFVPSLLS